MPDTAELFPKITEDGLEQLRQRIGRPIENTAEPWCYEATRDNIRHYAHGIGDDNPLWCDPEYAAGTRHGGIIALPSFLFTTSRIISGGSPSMGISRGQLSVGCRSSSSSKGRR